MSEAYGPDFITVTDEEGNEFELELIDTLEHHGVTYHALFPAAEKCKWGERQNFTGRILPPEIPEKWTYFRII